MPNNFEETVENASDVYIIIIKCLQTIYYYVLHHVVLVISTWKQTYYCTVFPTCERCQSSTVCTIFCRELLQQIKKGTEKELWEEQAGFRSGRSFLDRMFMIRAVIEQSLQWNSSFYINFIDFLKKPSTTSTIHAVHGRYYKRTASLRK